MDCKECQIFISTYIDDELSDIDKGRIEEHLKNCKNCQSMFHYELSFKNFVKSQISFKKAPIELKNKLSKGSKLTIKPTIFFNYKTLSMAVSTLILVLFVSPSFMGYTTILDENISDLSKDIEVYSNNNTRLINWVNNRTDEKISPLKYNRTKLKMSPIGAFIKKQSKRAVIVYHYRGKKIIYKKLPQMDYIKKYPIKKIGNKKFYLKKDKNYYNLFWEKNSQLYSLTSNLPYNHFQKIISNIK